MSHKMVIELLDKFIYKLADLDESTKPGGKGDERGSGEPEYVNINQRLPTAPRQVVERVIPYQREDTSMTGPGVTRRPEHRDFAQEIYSTTSIMTRALMEDYLTLKETKFFYTRRKDYLLFRNVIEKLLITQQESSKESDSDIFQSVNSLKYYLIENLEKIQDMYERIVGHLITYTREDLKIPIDEKTLRPPQMHGLNNLITNFIPWLQGISPL